MVIETMQPENLSYKETARRFVIKSDRQVIDWGRIYLAEGPRCFPIERKDRSNTGRPKKLPDKVEKDLLAVV